MISKAKKVSRKAVRKLESLKDRPARYLESRRIKASGYFDATTYLAQNGDVREAGIDPALHYVQHGWREGRNPSKEFDTNKYLSRYPEVRRGRESPLAHFLGLPVDEQQAFLENAPKSVPVTKSPATDTYKWPIAASIDFPEAASQEFVEWVESIELQHEPLVSVVIPTWNRSAQVVTALESVLSQTYRNWEVLVVDDGSTDDTRDRVSSYLKDPRIRFIQCHHGGASRARNQGLAASRGSYVAYLDTDNSWTPNFLDYMVRALTARNARCGYAITCRIRDNGVRFGCTPYSRKELLNYNFIDLNVFMHERALAEEFGGFDEELFRGIDWDLVLRLTSENDALFCPFTGCRYDDAPTEGRISVTGDSQHYHVMYKHRNDLLDWVRLRAGVINKRLNKASILMYGDAPIDAILRATRAVCSNTSGDYELLIVDPLTETVHSKQLRSLAQTHNNVRIVAPAHKTVGRAIALSLAFAASDGEFVILLQPYARVSKGWLPPLLRELRSDDRTVWAQSQLGDSSAGQSEIVARHFRNSLFRLAPDRDNPVHADYDEPLEGEVIAGGCYAMRASDFGAVEGLDSAFPGDGCDIDLYCRVSRQLAGKAKLTKDSTAEISLALEPERSFTATERLLQRRWPDALGVSTPRARQSDVQEIKYSDLALSESGQTKPYLTVRTGGSPDSDDAGEVNLDALPDWANDEVPDRLSKLALNRVTAAITGTTKAKAYSEALLTSTTEARKSCVICGNAEYQPGPKGRSGINGDLPQCTKCYSLERHRNLRQVYNKIPEAAFNRARALQFSPDMCVPREKFAEFELSIYGKQNSLDIQDIDRPDGSYDWVIANHVLEHVEHDAKAFRELVRITTPDGIMQFSVPAPDSKAETRDWGYADENDHGHWRIYGIDILNKFNLSDLYLTMAVTIDPPTAQPDLIFMVTRSEETFQALTQWMKAEAGDEESLPAPTHSATPMAELEYQERATQVTPIAPERVEFVSHDTLSLERTVKALAYYLPQFHPTEENDRWWGRGFTEWTNVTSALPQFLGHYQPHLPIDLGFYDLRVPAVLERQVELAKNYGIHGFCFYYYWFNGTRLLESPIQTFANNPNINFPFCLFYANDSWTRTWKGHRHGDDPNATLMEQVHSEEDDLSFIAYAMQYLQNPQYVTVSGKPLLIVYKPGVYPDIGATTERWRKYCRERGIEIFLVHVQNPGDEAKPPHLSGFDAQVQFCPVNSARVAVHPPPLLNRDYQGTLYDYNAVVDYELRKKAPPFPLFRSVFPTWDNEPRKPGRGLSYVNGSPSAYKRWLEGACNFALKHPVEGESFVFINAWNEWAEGAHLEPDRRYGYAYLEQTYQALQSTSQKLRAAAKPQRSIG